jgi:hypothetical protein
MPRGFISILSAIMLGAVALRPLVEYKLIRERIRVYMKNAMLEGKPKHEP